MDNTTNKLMARLESHRQRLIRELDGVDQQIYEVRKEMAVLAAQLAVLTAEQRQAA